MATGLATQRITFAMLSTLKAISRDHTRLGALCCVVLAAWLQFALVLPQSEHEDGSSATACHACVVLKHIGHALPPADLPALEAGRRAHDLRCVRCDARPFAAHAYHSRAPPRPAALT